MKWSFLFFFNSIFLGVGLAMDAFSVSVANGLHNNKMKKSTMAVVAGTFAGFQFIMPLAGWVCVHTVVEHFKTFQRYVPYVALILLVYIGGRMICESDNVQGEDKVEIKSPAPLSLIIQGVATSIDALSVGFTISDREPVMAVVSAMIIGLVTFVICIIGLIIGKKFGAVFSDKAELLGGVILIFIGIEIFVKGIL